MLPEEGLALQLKIKQDSNLVRKMLLPCTKTSLKGPYSLKTGFTQTTCE